MKTYTGQVAVTDRPLNTDQRTGRPARRADGRVCSGPSIGTLNVRTLTRAPLRQFRSVRLRATPEGVFKTISELGLPLMAPCVNHSRVVFSEPPEICAVRLGSHISTLADHVIVFKVQQELGGTMLHAYQYFNAQNTIRQLITEMFLTKVLKSLVRLHGGQMFNAATPPG